MSLDSILLGATFPLKLLHNRSSVIERLLKIPLSDDDISSLNTACARSRVRIGEYYHWYLKKLIISQRIRNIDAHSVRGMLSRCDHTDYSVLDGVAQKPGGLLVAIPHHGHYILSIVGAVEYLRQSRDVSIFYGDPKTHAGNEIFDTIHRVLWSSPTARVQVIYDTRSGIAKAIRGLQNGAVVIILPDVYKDNDETFLLPFCGRALNVMLGTAALARRTRANILPMVSQPRGLGVGFSTIWGPVLWAAQAIDDSAGAGTNITDYRATVAMFRFFEEVMDGSVIYWQYVRQHYMSEIEFPVLTPESIPAIADLVLASPHANLNLDNAFQL